MSERQDQAKRNCGSLARLRPKLSYRGRRKMQFCIKCMKQLSRNEIQAGVESLEPERNIWGLKTSGEQKAPDMYQEVLLSILTEDK